MPSSDGPGGSELLLTMSLQSPMPTCLLTLEGGLAATGKIWPLTYLTQIKIQEISHFYASPPPGHSMKKESPPLTHSPSLWPTPLSATTKPNQSQSTWAKACTSQQFQFFTLQLASLLINFPSCWTMFICRMNTTYPITTFISLTPEIRQMAI